jgi:choline dehydrogenase-like flavoprotein
MNEQGATVSKKLLSTSGYRAAVALARAIIPAGRRLPGCGPRAVEASERLAEEMSAGGAMMFRQLVLALDWLAVLHTGSRFQKLGPAEREEVLRGWEQSSLMRWPLFVLAGLFKSTHFDHPEVYDAFDVEYFKGGPSEKVRWVTQVHSGDDWDADELVECDVVVVGTGPGGAIVGKELADQGHAVVFVEEGRLYRREAFRGSVLTAHQKFYRGQAKVASWGNTMVPVLMGRLVGGSSAINTGTCFRTPDWILDRWCEDLHSDALSPERLRPHFERVERALQIGPNEDKLIGPIGPIVARGCEQLGWSHFKVPRNAPDCDTQSCCDFGCPSGARLSMDVTYIPKALERGAVLFTDTKATRVWIENGRAVGIEARSVERDRTIRIRSQAVVLACGAVPTPVLLQEQSICNRSGQVGRNLSLHPGAAVSGLFDDVIEGYKHVPQGVGCDQFHRQGILLLGAQSSLNIASHMFQFAGRRLTEVMDDFDRIGAMGVLVKDATQNGRVRPGLKGEPLITYWLQRKDLDQMHRGMVHIMELFRAAGARKLYPLGHRMPIIETDADFERFRKRRVAPSDIIWPSFHPLGTIRMGANPTTSVVGFDHETHDVKGLFVVDGGTVPGPTAVNPQLTIMAMADRAAQRIGETLD